MMTKVRSVSPIFGFVLLTSTEIKSGSQSSFKLVFKSFYNFYKIWQAMSKLKPDFYDFDDFDREPEILTEFYEDHYDQVVPGTLSEATYLQF